MSRLSSSFDVNWTFTGGRGGNSICITLEHVRTLIFSW